MHVRTCTRARLTFRENATWLKLSSAGSVMSSVSFPFVCFMHLLLFWLHGRVWCARQALCLDFQHETFTRASSLIDYLQPARSRVSRFVTAVEDLSCTILWLFSYSRYPSYSCLRSLCGSIGPSLIYITIFVFLLSSLKISNMEKFTVPARKLLGLEIFFFALATTALVLRHVASRMRKRSFQLHDLFCFLSWVLDKTFLIFSTYLLISSEA